MFNETIFLGCLDDYVRSGDDLYYAANIGNVAGDPLGIIPGGATPATRDMLNGALADIRSNGFVITSQEVVPSAGSFAVNVRAPGDFSDANDVKALFDGILQSRGARILSSTIQHRTLNLASRDLDRRDPDPFSTAATFWGEEISKVAGNLGSQLAQSSGAGLLTLAVIGVVAFLLLKR